MKLNYFSISFLFNLLICKICFLFFNKYFKNKILISYFLWYNQTLKNIFQLIFHNTIKFKTINQFLRIYFIKKPFSKIKKFLLANKRGLKKRKKRKNLQWEALKLSLPFAQAKTSPLFLSLSLAFICFFDLRFRYLYGLSLPDLSLFLFFL
jgi:hypothetical protein